MKDLLERLHDKYNNSDFIEFDPISVPHCFSSLQDIEISGFLSSTIAWGNRKSIVKSAVRMMDFLDNAPYDFVVNASDNELLGLKKYVHRTFNGEDFTTFILALRYIYSRWGSMKNFFETSYSQSQDLRVVLREFWDEFFTQEHDNHAHKHLSSIAKGAACKRLNMFLRWMVRSDDRGVDFGLWTGIPMSALYLPLDVHTASMGRALGLLERKQNDWKAVEQITASLREFCSEDPVRYDFSLFGAGIDGFLK